jgi:hypothetical protein
MAHVSSDRTASSPSNGNDGSTSVVDGDTSETTGDVVVGTLATRRAYVQIRQRVRQLTPPAPRSAAGLRGLFSVELFPCGRLRVGQCRDMGEVL